MATESLRLRLLRRSRAAWVAYREIRRATACDYIVVARAKSGRTWLRAMLSRLYQRRFGLAEHQLLEFDNFHRQDARAATVLFTHGHELRRRLQDPRWRRRLASTRIVFLVRHPIDVAVSEYFQSTRRATGLKRELLGVDRDDSMLDFVLESNVGLPATIDYLNEWVPVLEQLQGAKVVRYEDMRARPLETLEELVRFLGAPFSREEIREAVEFGSFENLKKLEKEDFFRNKRLQARDPDDPESFKVRRGKVGGYVDYFSDEERQRLEAMVRDRLSPFYGYSPAAPGAEAAAHGEIP